MKISKLKSSLRPLHLNIRGYQEPEIVHLVFSLTSKFYNKKSEQMLSFKFHLIIFSPFNGISIFSNGNNLNGGWGCHIKFESGSTKDNLISCF